MEHGSAPSSLCFLVRMPGGCSVLCTGPRNSLWDSVVTGQWPAQKWPCVGCLPPLASCSHPLLSHDNLSPGLRPRILWIRSMWLSPPHPQMPRTQKLDNTRLRRDTGRCVEASTLPSVLKELHQWFSPQPFNSSSCCGDTQP